MPKKLRLPLEASAYFRKLWAGMHIAPDPTLDAVLEKQGLIVRHEGTEVTFTRYGRALGELFDAAAANEARAAARAKEASDA